MEVFNRESGKSDMTNSNGLFHFHIDPSDRRGNLHFRITSNIEYHPSKIDTTFIVSRYQKLNTLNFDIVSNKY